MVKGGTAPEPGAIILPPGDYSIHGRLEDSVYRLNSDPLTFTVR